MPTIEFSETDFLRQKIVDPAWYRLRIDGVGEKDSKDGNSTLYPMEGVILFNADNGDKEFTGVPLDGNNWQFNDTNFGKSLILGFLQALTNGKIEPNKRVELRDAIGKEIDAYIAPSMWQGKTKNSLTDQYRHPREIES